MAALVLGIVSLALLLVTFGLSTIISLACAIPAIVLGRKGRRLVDSAATRKHRGLAVAGYIMGIIGTALSVVAIVGWTALILSDDFQRGFDEGLQQELDQNQGLDQSSAGLLAIQVLAPAVRLLLG